jgi:hypothetical protein
MGFGDLAQFVLLFLNLGIPGIAGFFLGGYGIYAVPYAAFWVFFFGFFEIRVLCSHCPFYAEKGLVLHCLANYGLLKLWRHRPGPLKTWEKAGFLLGVAFLFGYPLVFLVLGQQHLLLAIYLAALVNWSVVMQRNVCRRCVNFSCPLNRVPKRVVDEYLRRNEVMRNAWEADGYELGPQPVGPQNRNPRAEPPI